MKDQKLIDVLICGAGAAGLTLAIDLARRGISFRLIDKLPEPFAGSRGKGIQPRTLEVFEDLGIVEQIAAVGGSYPPQRVYHVDGSHDDAQIFAATPPTAQEPYRIPLMVPQYRTEAIMRERLAAFDRAPEYGRELLAFEQDADQVIAQVSGPDGSETIRCRYLVGGDGGRSFVRHALQIDFPGKTLGVRAIAADMVLDGLPRDAWHRFNDGQMEHQVALCPLPHTGLFQLQAPIPLDGDIDLSTAGLQALLDERIPGSGLTVGDVAWASAYSMNARLADRYRIGRVLLIGDAAHIHPPTGGQGLNTSVQDAYNLGWKLGAVLAGAPDTLLDSYEEERRPIAAAVLGLSVTLLDKARQGDLRRGRDVHQLDLGYRGSSLSLEVPERHDGVLAGDRAPDARLQGANGERRRLFDLLRGPHWTLLAHRSTLVWPTPHADLHIHHIGPDLEYQDEHGDLARTYGLSAGDLLLTRPDGYVAGVVGGGEQSRIQAYLQTWLN